MMCAVQLILVINVPSDCLINFLNVCTHRQTERKTTTACQAFQCRHAHLQLA